MIEHTFNSRCQKQKISEKDQKEVTKEVFENVAHIKMCTIDLLILAEN